MHWLSRHARQLFGIITQRNNHIKHCLHSSSCNTFAHYEDPVEFYAQKEHEISSWTFNISDMVWKGKPDEAIAVFKTMLMEGQRPNDITMLSVIKALDLLNWVDMMWVIHGLVIKMGFEIDVAVSTALIGFHSTFDMETVWKLFDQIPCKDIVLWSSMVSTCVKNGWYIEAFNLFREMQDQGVQPNHVSVVSILPACAALSIPSYGREIHGFSIKRMFYSLTNIQNSLVDMYAKCRNLNASIQVFDRIREKDMVSWRTIIHACIQNGCPSKASDIFSGMRCSGFEVKETVIPDMISVSFLSEDFRFGLALHCYTMKSGLLGFVTIGTSLLQMYAKFGEMESARDVFDQISDKDFIVWSAMISAYSRGGELYNALNTFKMMQSMTENPNEVIFVSLLQACSLMDAYEIGESIYGHVIKSGYLSNAHLMSALIDFYCRIGRIVQGEAIFDEIPIKDLICWSSMIKGYGMNGAGTDALRTFSNMLHDRIVPNEVVFVSVLSACSQCGLEDEGWIWFHSMEEKYGISPKLAHYACMVDLLCRRGNVKEAFDFVNKMPMKPDKRIWGAILAACKSSSGVTEIEEFVEEQLTAC